MINRRAYFIPFRIFNIQRRPLNSSWQTSIEQLCSRGSQKARDENTPILVSASFPLAEALEKPLLGLLAHENGFRFYWERPNSLFAIAASGIAQSFQAEGPSRFEEVNRHLSTAIAAAEMESTTEAGVGELCAVGGFSFFERLETEEWPGFLPAQLIIPRWMVTQQKEGITGRVTRQLRPTDDPEKFAREIITATEELQALFQATLEGAEAATLASGTASPPPLEIQQNTLQHTHWINMVRTALEEIRSQRLQKVVLARMERVTFNTPPAILSILGQLRKTYPDCVEFLFDPGAGQSFLGATPERLVEMKNGQFKLEALAGTAARGSDPTQDEQIGQKLLAEHKEQQEHQFVVDGIMRTIGELGRVERPAAPTLTRYNNVQHLSTPITLHPDHPISLLKLVELLHPTAAVGGHPSPEALAWIRAHEDFCRGWYAAPIGWINASGEGEFAVALRSGKFTGKSAGLFAGGGIVADSDPEREFQETELKLKPMLTACANG